MNRRNFLAGMLAACAAPAIVRASSLMPITYRDVERAFDLAYYRQEFARHHLELLERALFYAVNPPVIAFSDGHITVVRTRLPDQFWRMLDAAKTR